MCSLIRLQLVHAHIQFVPVHFILSHGNIGSLCFTNYCIFMGLFIFHFHVELNLLCWVQSLVCVHISSNKRNEMNFVSECFIIYTVEWQRSGSGLLADVICKFEPHQRLQFIKYLTLIAQYWLVPGTQFSDFIIKLNKCVYD